MPETSQYRLHQSLGFALSIVTRQQESRFDAMLKTIGLTRINWCILLAVGNEGCGMPSEIAAFVGIDRAAISRALLHLEKDAVLTRKSGFKDRRTRQISLTSKGRALINQGTPFARKNAAVLAACLTQNEHKELQRLLQKLQRNDEPPLNHF